MTASERLVFAFVAGAAFMLVICMLGEDLMHSAPRAEKASCTDRPDTRAYMARDPGSPHTTEACLQAMRFGSPTWVPELGHPLQPRKGM